MDEKRPSADDPLAAALEPVPVRRIGPYRVHRELGRGGMGVVYLGERDDGQFRRLVAIKVLRASPDAEELRARFMAERQILASLDHPNIAQLLDAGVTDGQLPYLVMEYVEGLPVTTYCDRNRLDVRGRLELFRRVCGAVHHAHRNLVIHRDLKPSNILVTEGGEVKLLDFGIAKLQNPGLVGMPVAVTRTDLRVLTPEYASPEQVRGEPLSTASDIYALGVVLYELLAGCRPNEAVAAGAGGSGGSGGELAVLMEEREPVRPSTVVVSAAGAGVVAAARDTTPERLRRVLRGDLDAIVLMALRREPGRRYGSADVLAEDVRRYLEGLPVVAHKGSRRYYARKYLERHRAGAVVVGLAAAGVLTGAGLAFWQAGVARTERDRAEQARQQAEEITAFLMGLFEAGDPLRTRGDTVTARELMERGVARAERLEGQPLVQARLFDVVGRVYQSMGRYEQAQPLLERALALQIAERGTMHADVASSLGHVAELMRQRGHYDSAQALLVRAAQMQRELPEASDSAYAGTLGALSRVAVQRGDLDAAEQWIREALDVRRRTLGPAHALTAGTLTELGTVLRERGDYPGAEQAFREALRLRRAASDPGVDELLHLADLMQYDLAQPAPAAEIYRQALAVLRASPEPDDGRLVRALGGLARTMEQRGELDGAETLLREALELRRSTYGPEHPLVSAGLIHLAGFYERSRRYDEAVALFREAAALDVELLGETHPTHAGTLTAIGRVLIAAGRLADADTVLDRALTIRMVALGTEHPLVARTLRQRAELQYRQGDYAAAEATIQQALAIYLAQRQPEATDVRNLHALLADVYTAWGRPDDAARYRARAQDDS